MDGNGRWAKKRGLPRKAGHSQGAKVFRRTVEDCRDIGIKYCTFYAFSTENWKRPKDEVDAIMKLLVKYLDDIRSMAPVSYTHLDVYKRQVWGWVDYNIKCNTKNMDIILTFV